MEIKLSDKNSFLFGSVAGILIIFSLGFLVMLPFTIKGVKASLSEADSGTKKVLTAQNQNNANGQPNPDQPSNADIVLADITKSDYYKGSFNAPVTIVEFSDTECPFCQRFHDTMNQVMAEYGDQVMWVYKHAPLDSLHRKARSEAEAAECAGELGGNEGFWRFLDRLFEVTPSNDGLPASQLPEIAVEAGLNRQAFESCLASERYAEKVQNQLVEAQRAGLRGTPYSVIIAGNQQIPINGAYSFEQMRSLIDQLIN